MLESRQDMLCKISEVSFALNDLTLYLDTHPTDSNALELFQQYHQERKDLMQQFASEYQPLTVDCVNVDQSESANSSCKYANQKHFNWVDGPLPWEGGAA